MEVLSFASTAHDEFLGAAPSAMNMLEEFNFDDICVDFNDKGVLPDLAEVDFADFSFEGNSEIGKAEENRDNGGVERNENKEIISSVDVSTANSPSPELANKEVKKSKLGNGKGSHGKRKVKVDWTPELHRKFVQAVEQLDIDKAVPSRILEIMGIDGLTRHNIASHLQKYRSHRKHMMAREAEAASWSQRRHLSSSTVCIPHPHPQAVPFHHVPFRPLHVWGHPAWAPSPWHHAAVTLGTPCFPRPLLPPQVRFSPPLAVPRIPPPPPPAPHPLMYRPADVSGSTPVQPVHPNNKKLASQLQILDASPTKESIDEVIGDALAKPWLRLPLGLKPPSLDSVLVELHKQGISTVPPTNG